MPSAVPSQPSPATTHPTASANVSTPRQASSNSGPPPAPKTVLEALEQRLEKYQTGVQDAEKEGNSGKARRMNRIVKVMKIGQEYMIVILREYYVMLRYCAILGGENNGGHYGHQRKPPSAYDWGEGEGENSGKSGREAGQKH